VSAGGRARLTALFVAVFFLAALFFAPFAVMVPAGASAAALLYVACVTARGLAEIDWDDMTEAAPAVIAAVSMPLTYSIATGIGLGFVTYAPAKIVAGRFADAKPPCWFWRSSSPSNSRWDNKAARFTPAPVEAPC
jgi:AGZA family xanthine/uracil permease-like MFS transporter